MNDRTAFAGYPTLRPMALPLGVLLLTYAIWVIRTTRIKNDSAQFFPRGALGATVGIVLLSTFWTFSEAAERAGARDSYLLYANGLSDLPRVVIYSENALVLNAPGVKEISVGSPESIYHWQYEGLRLLVHSGEKFFLLPAGWPDGHQVVLSHIP